MLGRTLISFLLSLAFLSQVASAETAYVTDKLTITMRTGPASDYKIRRMLPSGTQIKILERVDDGYIKVSANGETGYVLERYLIDNAPSMVLYPALKKRIDSLSDGQKGILDENKSLATENDKLKSSLGTTQKNLDELRKKMERIERASADVIQLDKKAQTLQMENIALKNELDFLKTENDRLSGKEEHKWFLYGAFTLFAGCMMGLVIPSLRPKKKTQSW